VYVGLALLMPNQGICLTNARAHVLPLNRKVAVLKKSDVVIAPIINAVRVVVSSAAGVHIDIIELE